MSDTHRWSGWPGAWCLDCGVECYPEIGLADVCEDCTDEQPCPKHTNAPCPEPGSNRHNPYIQEQEAIVLFQPNSDDDEGF